MRGASGFHQRLLTIGGNSTEVLLERLAAASVSLNDYARTLFADERFTTEAEPRTLHVVARALPDLGLAEGGTFGEILAAASARGLAPCPLEVAPHLRLAWTEQPVGPYLTVASLPLDDAADAPNGLYLRHLDDGLWLRGYRADDDYVYAPEFTEFVFVDPSANA